MLKYNQIIKGAKKEPNQSTDRAQMILNKLKENPKISQRDLAKELGLTRKQVQNIFNELLEDNKLERKGPNKGGYWIIK